MSSTLSINIYFVISLLSDQCFTTFKLISQQRLFKTLKVQCNKMYFIEVTTIKSLYFQDLNIVFWF